MMIQRLWLIISVLPSPLGLVNTDNAVHIGFPRASPMASVYFLCIAGLLDMFMLRNVQGSKYE